MRLFGGGEEIPRIFGDDGFLGRVKSVLGAAHRKEPIGIWKSQIRAGGGSPPPPSLSRGGLCPWQRLDRRERVAGAVEAFCGGGARWRQRGGLACLPARLRASVSILFSILRAEDAAHEVLAV